MSMSKECLRDDIEMLSPLNLSPEVLGSFNVPKKITLVDATIREGE